MKASSSLFAKMIGVMVIAAATQACGSDSADGGPMGSGCENGVTASKNDFFPLIVGNTWQYLVTAADGSTGMKLVELTEEMTPAGETEPVVVQKTTKPEGITVNWLRQQGDAVVRLRQEDYTPDMMLERTTVYNPPRTRFDGSADRIMLNAEFSETYTNVVTDAAGMMTSTEVTDSFKVTAVDKECNAGWGKLSCLELSETRVTGGVAQKEFYFARGYGKVAEIGDNQTEQLVGCTLK